MFYRYGASWGRFVAKSDRNETCDKYHHDLQRSPRHTDYSFPSTFPYFSVADFAYFKNAPCKLAAVARDSGFYAREGMPGNLGLLLGLVLHYCLILAGTFFLFE